MTAFETKLNAFVNSQAPSHDQITGRAYDIYINSGCQPGRCQLNWAKAERELRNEMNAAADDSNNAKAAENPLPVISPEVKPPVTSSARVQSGRRASRDKASSGSGRGRELCS